MYKCRKWSLFILFTSRALFLAVVMPQFAKRRTVCHYCGKDMRRDNLAAHTKAMHPSERVREKNDQDVFGESLF